MLGAFIGVGPDDLGEGSANEIKCHVSSASVICHVSDCGVG